MRKLWVDFNERTDSGLVIAVPELPDTVESFPRHEMVLAYDGDGNSCPGYVAEVHPDWLALAIEWNAFDAARPQIAGQISLV